MVGRRSLHYFWEGLFSGATVDGRNPAPVDMVYIPFFIFTGLYKYSPGVCLGVLNHQQYVVSFKENPNLCILSGSLWTPTPAALFPAWLLLTASEGKEGPLGTPSRNSPLETPKNFQKKLINYDWFGWMEIKKSCVSYFELDGWFGFFLPFQRHRLLSLTEVKGLFPRSFPLLFFLGRCEVFLEGLWDVLPFLSQLKKIQWDGISPLRKSILYK